MKTRTQKLISLVLVLMMLVTMVPMGIFSANAAVTAELQTALDSKATELVIYSAEDWNAVAAAHTSYLGAQNQTFVGVTIKLGANIDAAGAALNSFAPAGTAFYGTFDGQGHTVSNVTVAGADNTGLIANAFGGGKITNVNFDNITLSTTAGNIGLVAGQNSIWATTEVSNINATNITITSNGTGNVGGLIGNHANNNNFTQVVKNVNFQGTVNAPAGGNAGGVVGAAGIGGVTQWSNLYIDVDVVTNKTTPVTNLGGFAASYSVNAGKKIEISNVYLTGSVKDENKSSSTHTGFIGMIEGQAGAKISTNDTTGEILLHDIVLANDLSNMCGNSLVFAGLKNGSLEFENLYSITKSNNATWSGSTQRWTWLSSNTNSLFNGIYCEWGGAGDIDETIDTVDYVSPAVAAAMVLKDANGYVSGIESPVGLKYELLNYANVSTFVIKSVEDWELIASYGATKNFSGKNVVLGKDIDAQGATLPTLVAVGAGSCAIRFDGAGYTIRNVGTAQAPQTEPLITGKFADGTVRNVTFENVIMVGNDATNGSALIADWASAWATGTITNIVVKGCSIKDTAGYAAALIGKYCHNSAANDILNISNVIIDANTTIEGTLHTGGLVGYIYGNSCVNNFSNIYSEANLSAAEGQYVGGMVGYLTGSSNASYVNNTTFTNCVIKGTLTAINGTSWTGRIGGAYGRATNAIDVNVYNSIFAPSSATGGMVLSQPIGSSNGAQDLDFRNCYYKTKTFTSVYYVENSSHTYNGASTASGHQYYAGVLETSAAQVENLYRTDANGFVTYVSDHIDAEAIQSSKVSGNTYAVRFIATSQLAEATDVNMVVIATYTDGTGTHKLKFDSAASTTGECKLYDYLTVYSEYGIATRAVSASEYNAEKLAGFTIYGIPTGFAISFEVTTSYVDADGIVVTGANTMTVNFDANGALIK